MAAVVLEETMLGVRDRLGGLFGRNEEPEDENAGCLKRCWKEAVETCQLSGLQKMIIGGVLAITGVLFCGFSLTVLLLPTRFAKFYTFGSLCLTAASMFVVSPATQLRGILANRSRTICAIAYAISIFLTLFAALKLHSTILTAIAVIVQICASLYYAASYIPGAQSCLHGTARTLLPI